MSPLHSQKEAGVCQKLQLRDKSLEKHRNNPEKFKTLCCSAGLTQDIERTSWSSRGNYWVKIYLGKIGLDGFMHPNVISSYLNI